MADIVPQLEFDGRCGEAFERYAEIFGGEIAIMNRLGETGDIPLPPGSTGGAPDMVRFAELRIGSTRIFGNDLPPDEYRRPQGVNLAMHFETADAARRAFDRLAEGGEVTVPPAKVAWAELFAMVTDRFGIPWLILGFAR